MIFRNLTSLTMQRATDSVLRTLQTIAIAYQLSLVTSEEFAPGRAKHASIPAESLDRANERTEGGVVVPCDAEFAPRDLRTTS